MIRTTYLTLLALLLVGSVAQAQSPWPRKEPVTIGIVQDDDNGAVTDVLLRTQAEIEDLLAGEYEVRFPAQSTLGGNTTLAAAQKSIRRLLAAPGVDLVLTIGYISSTAACHMDLPLNKPVLAPFALDARLQGLVPVDGGSGIENLHYLAADAVGRAGFEALRQLLPVETLAVIAPSCMAQVNPAYRETALARAPGLKDLTLVSMSDDLADVVAGIPGDADAVVALTETLDRDEVVQLADLLIGRGLPSYSYLGHRDVELGFLAGMVSPEKITRLTRRTALTVQRILLGDEPSRIPVAFSLKSQLGINMKTADELGISPPWDLQLEAELVAKDQEQDIERVDLAGAVDLALVGNRDLAADREAVAAGRAQVAQAGSSLWPQFEVGARGTLIDEDRAAASFGSQPERTLAASADATLVLYSDGAWANLTAQEHLQIAREAGLRQSELDLTLDVALAYLNVLQTQTAEDIRTENLRLTQFNLELAKQRGDIGVAGPAEVYRWEAEISQRRQELISANSQRNLAEIELNRLLNRGLEKPLLLSDLVLDDPMFVLSGAWLAENLPNARTFKKFREWVAMEAIANSPELIALDATCAAQQRVVVATGRAMWLPEVFVAGSFEHILDRAGAGSAGGFSIPGIDLPETDDDNWSLTVGASLPLFEGGGLRADRSEARAGLAQLEYQRAGTAERIAQAGRSAYHRAGASFANIRHARAGAEAARKTLAVITDAYARGAADVLDLLDAQNAALVSDLVAANAEYDFLGDSMRTQRALGRFDFGLTAEERDALRVEIETYLAGWE